MAAGGPRILGAPDVSSATHAPVFAVQKAACGLNTAGYRTVTQESSGKIPLAVPVMAASSASAWPPRFRDRAGAHAAAPGCRRTARAVGRCGRQMSTTSLKGNCWATNSLPFRGRVHIRRQNVPSDPQWLICRTVPEVISNEIRISFRSSLLELSAGGTIRFSSRQRAESLGQARTDLGVRDGPGRADGIPRDGQPDARRLDDVRAQVGQHRGEVSAASAPRPSGATLIQATDCWLLEPITGARTGPPDSAGTGRPAAAGGSPAGGGSRTRRRSRG